MQTCTWNCINTLFSLLLSSGGGKKQLHFKVKAHNWPNWLCWIWREKPLQQHCLGEKPNKYNKRSAGTDPIIWKSNSAWNLWEIPAESLKWCKLHITSLSKFWLLSSEQSLWTGTARFAGQHYIKDIMATWCNYPLNCKLCTSLRKKSDGMRCLFKLGT